MTTQSVGKLDAGPIRNMGDGVHDDNPQIPEKLRDADEALNFIVEMTVGLRQLAEHHRLPFVSYLLEMAVLEASRGLKKGLEG